MSFASIAVPGKVMDAPQHARRDEPVPAHGRGRDTFGGKRSDSQRAGARGAGVQVAVHRQRRERRGQGQRGVRGRS
eukprot:4303289-Pyramimonas_sp.AAC.1